MSGPQKKVEIPMRNKIPALEALTTSDVVPNSSAISLAAEKSDVLLKVAVKAVKLVAKTTSHFVAVDALYPGDVSSRSTTGGVVVDATGVCFSSRAGSA